MLALARIRFASVDCVTAACTAPSSSAHHIGGRRSGVDVQLVGLVDGLMQAGFRVPLANTAAIQIYEGLKHIGDEHDAR